MDLMFDQYSRYRACADLLKTVGINSKNSILDVGSGPECQLGNFLPEADITYVDPLILVDSKVKAIRGDVFARELDNRQFDIVIAIDVLEHIPAMHRKAFIDRLISLATKSIVLAFPSSDSNVAEEVDKYIDNQYKEIFNKDYPWLDEHGQYGLPSVKNTKSTLEDLGLHCQTIGHGHAPWLKDLLGYLICIWEVPEMREFCIQISKEFNDKLYKYDFGAPHYREFIVASKTPLNPKITLETYQHNSQVDNLYKDILTKAKSRYLSASIDGFFKLDSKIIELNKLMNSKLAEKDLKIIELNS